MKRKVISLFMVSVMAVSFCSSTYFASAISEESEVQTDIEYEYHIAYEYFDELPGEEYPDSDLKLPFTSNGRTSEIEADPRSAVSYNLETNTETWYNYDDYAESMVESQGTVGR